MKSSTHFQKKKKDYGSVALVSVNADMLQGMELEYSLHVILPLSLKGER